MWAYEQSTGKLFDSLHHYVATGYSGKGEGKNNPAMQQVHNVGPIPVGYYDIGPVFNSDKHGPYCLRLTPRGTNEMFGRADFLIHGDKKDQPPGNASEGCIIMPRIVRETIATSASSVLWVK